MQVIYFVFIMGQFVNITIFRGVARIFQRGGHRGRALKLICWERVGSATAQPFLVTPKASPH